MIDKTDKTMERISFDNNIKSHLQEAITEIHKERYKYSANYVSDKVVLDIACGVGYGSKLIADSGAKRVIGVDISEEAINIANKSFKNEKTSYFASDYRSLNKLFTKNLSNLTSNEGFDIIVSLETIEHLKDPDDFLKKILKYLKPQGICIISVPITPSMDANPYHFHDFSNKRMQRLLKSNGLSIKLIIKQIQKYNPLIVRRDFKKAKRTDIRNNLMKFYFLHPSKFLLRIYSIMTVGFKNVYNIYITEKLN